jgi:RNA polymerase sigma-70 factor (ECF subfamily)
VLIPADSEALFTEHRQRLYRYFCRAVGEPDAARDLTQDVFVRVSRTTIPPASASGLRAWLFRIARNLALDHHRRRRAAPEMLPLSSAGERTASLEVSLAVEQALAALATLDRDVFLLRELGGLGYEEIADVCDLTPDAVRSRIHRARLQLRELLGGPIARHRGNRWQAVDGHS